MNDVFNDILQDIARRVDMHLFLIKLDLRGLYDEY
jgi:hypothetical protein